MIVRRGPTGDPRFTRELPKRTQKQADELAKPKQAAREYCKHGWPVTYERIPKMFTDSQGRTYWQMVTRKAANQGCPVGQD